MVGGKENLRGWVCSEPQKNEVSDPVTHSRLHSWIHLLRHSDRHLLSGILNNNNCHSESTECAVPRGPGMLAGNLKPLIHIIATYPSPSPSLTV